MKNEKKAAAEKAAAKATMLRLRAEAAKAEAAYLQDYATSQEAPKDGSLGLQLQSVNEAVAEAWDKYQEAANAAARAQKEADDAQAEAAKECWSEALTAAAAVKVRDYLLVSDIPADVMRVDEKTTFADLIAEALRSDAQSAAEAFANQYDLDSEPRDDLARRIDWLIECADDEGLDPATTLTPKAEK